MVIGQAGGRDPFYHVAKFLLLRCLKPVLVCVGGITSLGNTNPEIVFSALFKHLGEILE
jgi:hypothetical protein